MRTLSVALIWMAIFPAGLGERRNLPIVLADTVTFREVRRAVEVGTPTDLADSPDTLFVERPVHARAGAMMGVFVVSGDGVLVRRAVTYGRLSGTLIQIVSGVAPGDRVVVSDMSAWDAFDRLRLRW
jgi:HlyD family secretion protein